MPGKRLAIWAILVGLSASTGCCRYCERWGCPQQHQASAVPSQCCVPIQQCVPAQCSCPPGTVPANYAPGQPQPAPQSSWQRQFGAAPVAGQPACCE
jgi:hypothetical protein